MFSDVYLCSTLENCSLFSDLYLPQTDNFLPLPYLCEGRGLEQPHKNLLAAL